MQIKEIKTQKVLSTTQISLAEYVINPYRGCEIGCSYCYSQVNKNVKGSDFGNILSVKKNAPEILKKELLFIKPKRVLLGSTTECFQHKEIEYKITKEILYILNSHKIPYTILTKSHLISDYLNLIKENKENKIYFTFNFAKDRLIRIFEKKSSSLEQRISTLKQIRDSQIDLRIHIGPFIPFISDLENILELIPDLIKEIGVELYHPKQGNFSKIIELVTKKINIKTADEIGEVYSSQENYLSYSKMLKEKIKSLAKSCICDFFCVIPDFSQYYNSKIDYERPLYT